jgi:hypothetical protein
LLTFLVKRLALIVCVFAAPLASWIVPRRPLTLDGWKAKEGYAAREWEVIRDVKSRDVTRKATGLRFRNRP